MPNLMKYRDDGKENPLIKRPELQEAAFDRFCRLSFNETSLNAILKDVGMNKGSFYFQFYDKMDLYLCMLEMLAKDKAEYMAGKMQIDVWPDDFFWQLKLIARTSIEYGKKEYRYYFFWRNYLGESEGFRKTVKDTFPDIGDDFMGSLIDAAISSGQITTQYDRDFVHAIVHLYFNNIDALIDVDMSDDEILQKVDQLVLFLKNSLSST